MLENEHKMNKNIDQLSIPPAVLALADVTASERMLLALYAAAPDAKNCRALRVLGVGLAGSKRHRILINLPFKTYTMQSSVPSLPQRGCVLKIK